MLTHVVLFKMKDKKYIDETKERLLALKDKISYLKFIEVGSDILKTDRSYDIALITKFDSLEDMKAYQVHPEHVKFVEYWNEIKESTIAVDYES